MRRPGPQRRHQVRRCVRARDGVPLRRSEIDATTAADPPVPIARSQILGKTKAWRGLLITPWHLKCRKSRRERPARAPARAACPRDGGRNARTMSRSAVLHGGRALRRVLFPPGFAKACEPLADHLSMVTRVAHPSRARQAGRCGPQGGRSRGRGARADSSTCAGRECLRVT